VSLHIERDKSRAIDMLRTCGMIDLEKKVEKLIQNVGL
jgi:hypothetical protein